MATLAPPTFSTSTSSLRASQSQSHSQSQSQAKAAPLPYSYSDSPLTHLPTIDIPFDDLRRRMAEFTLKFDTFIEKGRKRVLEERNEFKAKLSELNDQKHSTKTQINSLQSTLGTHSHIVSRENVEKTDMYSQITELEAHQANQLAQRDRLKTTITQTQKQIEQKIEKQREYADRIDGQSRLNGPELGFWESYLGCRIEGSGDESKVRVVFVFPATAGGSKSGGEEREAMFELKVPETGRAEYEVVNTRPRLRGEDVAAVVARLNETREIASVLKGMRGLFVEEMK